MLLSDRCPICNAILEDYQMYNLSQLTLRCRNPVDHYFKIDFDKEKVIQIFIEYHKEMVAFLFAYHHDMAQQKDFPWISIFTLEKIGKEYVESENSVEYDFGDEISINPKWIVEQLRISSVF